MQAQVKAVLSSVITTSIFLSQAALAYVNEPQAIKGDDSRYANLVRNIPLDQVNSSTKRINLLIVGLDGESKNKQFYTLSDGSRVRAVSSRADSANIISIDLSEKKAHTIFGIYRGTLTPDSCWNGVAEKPEASTERIMNALFVLGGRSKYVSCMKKFMAENVLAKSQFQSAMNVSQYLNSNGEFPIHYLLEADFNTLNTALTGAMKFAFKKSGTLTDIMPLSSLLQIKPQQIIDGLRNRNDYEGAGYQRAFNHAKFISSALGYLGLAESVETDFTLGLEDIYKTLSYSHRWSDIVHSINTYAKFDKPLVSMSWVTLTENSNRSLPQFDIMILAGNASSALIYTKEGTLKKVLAPGTTLKSPILLNKINVNKMTLPSPNPLEKSEMINFTKGRRL